MVYLYYWALAGLISICVVQKIASSIRIARFKKAHGCKPLQKLPQSESIIGYGLFKEQVQESKDKKSLEAVRSRFGRMGPTFSAGKSRPSFQNGDLYWGLY
jgi:hypothetical protein